MSLYLLDGHALAYRAYYAFANQPLTNSSGEETSAVYGFFNTTLRLLQKRSPSHIAVAFDSTEATFRHEMFEDYKANRVAMPDSLGAQLPIIMALLDAMRVRHFAAPGYEADDIIATMVSRWHDDIPVAIVSGDKDLFQLISERVHVVRPGRGNVLEDEIGPAELERNTGLRPEQFVDLLALMGDSSDNIPGVRGVGEKTAKDLLQRFGNLKGIYDHLDDIKSSSVRRKLEAGKDDALSSRELVLLDHSVPMTVELAELETADYRTDELKELLGELEFDRFRRQVFSSRPVPTPDPPRVSAPVAAETSDPTETRYRAIVDEAGLKVLAGRLRDVDVFAVDVETSGLDPMRATLAGISVAVAAGEAYYAPVTSEIPEEGLGLLPPRLAPGLPLDMVRDQLGAIFAASKPVKVGQNIKYDAIVLERAGLHLGGVEFDTMLASYCLDPARRSHGLDALAEEVCAHRMIPFASLFNTRVRKKDIRTVPLDRVVNYACEDADYTLRLMHAFAPLLEVSQVRDLFANVEMPLQDVLMRMEMAGVRVDTEFLADTSRRYAAEIGELEEGIYRSVGERFNINSTAKLREVLFDKLGLQPSRRTKTGFSTDVDVLSSLGDAHEVVGLLLRYRQLVKLKSTYVDALPALVHPETGRVHTSYNQAVTTTGRLSSSDPNLQNIPIRTAEGREIRRAFVAGDIDSVLLDADYSQIELRILAHLCGDPSLQDAFRAGADIHKRTAARIMAVGEDEVTADMRARAKTVNFGIIYGMGPRGLAQSLGIEVEEARQFIDDYFGSHPGVKRFIDDTRVRAREDKAVSTMLGRSRRLPDIDSDNPRARAFSERIAVNTPVQGTAADIIKLAMLAVDREITKRNLSSRMILQVHDELLFDVPRAELEEMQQLVRECMEGAMSLDVPLVVEMGAGDNWLEAH